MNELPTPKVNNWQELYKDGARARCIKDDPPMYGFGTPLKEGDVVNVKAVCWRNGKYEISVAEQCASYQMEGYFEVATQEQGE